MQMLARLAVQAVKGELATRAIIAPKTKPVGSGAARTHHDPSSPTGHFPSATARYRDSYIYREGHGDAGYDGVQLHCAGQKHQFKNLGAIINRNGGRSPSPAGHVAYNIDRIRGVFGDAASGDSCLRRL
ncbi:hypothetical protein MMYC01_204727 [Madurella mycetomatis]|uniref:Uncharacterized protein n=1 Tax=Madurella mycetomatis TaxID=100816 RepID=A0A175W5W9_9PEZI|nr:hypothetical protein MMYC01_204727 [Madurella mycetomatis]